MKQQKKRSLCGLIFSFVMALTLVVAGTITEVHAAGISGPLYKIKDDGSDYDRETVIGTVSVVMTESGSGSVTGIVDGEYGGCTMDDYWPNESVKDGSMTIDAGYTNLVEYGINLAVSGYSEESEEISGTVIIPVPTGYDAASAKIWVIDLESYTSEGVADNGDGTISISASGSASEYMAGFGFCIEYKTKSVNPPAQDPPAQDPPVQDPPAQDPPAQDPPAQNPPAANPTKTVVIEATGDVVSAFSATDNVIPTTAVFKSTKVESGVVYENAMKSVNNLLGQSLKDFRVIEFDLMNNGVAIHDLGGYAEVSMDVPQGLKQADGFAFKVYRLDGDKLVACDTKYENGKITFTTNHFSTYIVAQEATTTNSTATDAKGEVKKAPKTGDNTVYLEIVLMSIMLLAASTTTVVYLRSRR